MNNFKDFLEEKQKWEEFNRALTCGDFAIGDSFWLNDIEFTVTNKRGVYKYPPLHFQDDNFIEFDGQEDDMEGKND